MKRLKKFWPWLVPVAFGGGLAWRKYRSYDPDVTRKEKLWGAFREASYWGFVVFLIVFVWKATTRW